MYSTIIFKLVDGTSSKWCSQYVDIKYGSDEWIHATDGCTDEMITGQHNIPYCIEHGSGQWVISMDDPEDLHGSGYQPVYTSSKNVTCPTEINYYEWENTHHYCRHKVEEGKQKANILECQAGPHAGMLQSILQLIYGREFSYSVLLHSCTR